MRRGVSLIFLAGVATLAGCSRPSESQPAGPAPSGVSNTQFELPADAQAIVTAKAEMHPLPDYLEIPAHLEPDPTRFVRVYAPAGGRLVAFEVRPGDRIAAGQTIAELESSEVSAALAAYAKAQSDLRFKQEAYRRALDLYDHGAFALKDLQQAKADAEMAQADVDNARRQLRVLNADPKGDSDQVRVTAPRSGVVLQTFAATGEYSKSLDSSDPLCVIADLGTIWAVGDLLEKDLASVRTGDAAELTVVAYPGESWHGRVGVISNTVDPATRTLKLRVVLSNEGLKLRPEMFGTLRLLRTTRTGLSVPNTAVLREGNANYIFVELSPGRFERREVTLGAPVAPDQFEIRSGLQASETFVAEGALLLRSVGP